MMGLKYRDAYLVVQRLKRKSRKSKTSGSLECRFARYFLGVCCASQSYIVHHSEKKSQHAWANNGSAPPLTCVRTCGITYARWGISWREIRRAIGEHVRSYFATGMAQEKSSPASRLAANSQKRLTLCGSGRLVDVNSLLHH